MQSDAVFGQDKRMWAEDVTNGGLTKNPFLNNPFRLTVWWRTSEWIATGAQVFVLLVSLLITSSGLPVFGYLCTNLPFHPDGASSSETNSHTSCTRHSHSSTKSIVCFSTWSDLPYEHTDCFVHPCLFISVRINRK